MSAHSAILPRSPDSIRVARRLVQTHSAMLGTQRREDATLMVSELVTNALVHGTGTISLGIEVAPDSLRVEVSDQGNVTLAPSPTAGAHGGWGFESSTNSPMTGESARAARRSGSGSARQTAPVAIEIRDHAARLG